MRIEVKQDVAGSRKMLGSDAPENVAEDVVVILFDEDWDLLKRSETRWCRHTEVNAIKQTDQL